MKDSFGGTIMIYIFIFFLGLYIVFIALTLRYAQSFRVKNKLIDVIEEHDGISDVDLFKSEVVPYLKSQNINPTDDTVKIDIVSIQEINVLEKCYYTVSSSIKWTWPFLGIEGRWVIKGETKNVKNCNGVTIDINDYDHY